MIKIVGLGPGSPDALTIGAVKSLEESKNLYFRTEKHPTVDYLKNGLKSFKTCDNYYEEGSSFDEVYSNIANEMIEEYKKYGELVYAVPGHPLVAERSVLNLINLCNENNIEYKILPAVSFVDAMMDRLQIDPIEGLKIIDAFDIKNQILDKRIGTIITQVYNHLIASEVKLELLEYYNDETEIYSKDEKIKGNTYIVKYNCNNEIISITYEKDNIFKVWHYSLKTSNFLDYMEYDDIKELYSFNETEIKKLDNQTFNKYFKDILDFINKIKNN